MCLAYALSLALIGAGPRAALVSQWLLPMVTLLAAGTLVRQLTGRLRRSEARLRYDAGHDAAHRASEPRAVRRRLDARADRRGRRRSPSRSSTSTTSSASTTASATRSVMRCCSRSPSASATTPSRRRCSPASGATSSSRSVRGELRSGGAPADRDAFEQPFAVAGYEFTVNASLGLAPARPAKTRETVLRHADTAAYEAKRAGRGALRDFDASMRAAISERLQLESDLARALDATSCGSPTSRSCRWATADHRRRGARALDPRHPAGRPRRLHRRRRGDRPDRRARRARPGHRVPDAKRWVAAVPGFRLSVNLSGASSTPTRSTDGRIERALARASSRTGAAARGDGDHRAHPGIARARTSGDRPRGHRARARRLRDRPLVALPAARA